MSEEDGAAPAAAEPVSMSETPTEAPVDHEFEPTPLGSIDRAFDAVERSEEDAGLEEANAAKAPDVKSDTRDDQPREQNGQFKAKQADVKPEGEEPTAAVDAAPDVEAKPDEPKSTTTDTFSEPPTRFSPDAKAAWKDAPAPVQAEIHRAVTELEQGIEKYRPAAEEWQGLAEFDALAKQSNTTVKTALANYVQADRILNQDPVRGLEHVAQMYGLSLRDVASQILGQPADQVQSQNDLTIRQLRQELADVKGQVGSVTSNLQKQREQTALAEIQEFANANPRFTELQAEIERQVSGGFTLKQAYERAERLNPVAPAPAAASIAVAQPEPAAQPGKGSLSLIGAPSSGSNPTDRRPPSSARDAVDKSFADLGLG